MDVGNGVGAISGKMKLSFQAARCRHSGLPSASANPPRIEIDDDNVAFVHSSAAAVLRMQTTSSCL
jgi:hypothetical protein